MGINMILDWIQARDYEKAQAEATKKIISKQARGSVSAQNGDVMSHVALDRQSTSAEASLERVKKAVSAK